MSLQLFVRKCCRIFLHSFRISPKMGAVFALRNESKGLHLDFMEWQRIGTAYAHTRTGASKSR
jgi:hypothetical protein